MSHGTLGVAFAVAYATTDVTALSVVTLLVVGTDANVQGAFVQVCTKQDQQDAF